MSLSLISPSNPILWTPTETVRDIKAQVFPYLDEMFLIMNERNGVGLAAPQVGISLSFFIWLNGIVINPKITAYRGWTADKEEGCLSFPGRSVWIRRNHMIDAEWLDETGKEIRNTIIMQDARIFQHEYDHLMGKCIVTRD